MDRFPLSRATHHAMVCFYVLTVGKEWRREAGKYIEVSIVAWLDITLLQNKEVLEFCVPC